MTASQDLLQIKVKKRNYFSSMRLRSKPTTNINDTVFKQR